MNADPFKVYRVTLEVLVSVPRVGAHVITLRSPDPEWAGGLKLAGSDVGNAVAALTGGRLSVGSAYAVLREETLA